MNKRILLLSYSGQYGGMEIRIVQESLFLQSLGYDVYVGINTFSGVDILINDLISIGVNVFSYNPPLFFEEWPLRRLKKLLAELFWKRYIKNVNPLLVHIFFCWTEMGGSRLWLAHECNIPCVISVHNVFPAQKFLTWHDKILKDSFKSVKGIYGVSHQAVEGFLQTYQNYILPETKVRAIYNFVDNTRFVPSIPKRLSTRDAFSIPQDVFLLGLVGRLDSQKRPDFVISIFSKLQKVLPNIHLAIVGKGPLEDLCLNRVEDLKLSDKVHFLGFQRNIENILPALDLFLLFSTREGHSLATAEAMACGIPVVATDVPGSNEIFNDSSAGVLISIEDEDKLIDDLTTLILDKNRLKAMSSAGPREVDNKYSHLVWENNIKSFYESLL